MLKRDENMPSELRKLKYDGKCADCGAELKAGEEARIYRTKEGRYVIYCPDSKNHRNPMVRKPAARPTDTPPPAVPGTGRLDKPSGPAGSPVKSQAGVPEGGPRAGASKSTPAPSEAIMIGSIKDRVALRLAAAKSMVDRQFPDAKDYDGYSTLISKAFEQLMQEEQLEFAMQRQKRSQEWLEFERAKFLKQYGGAKA